MLEKRDEVINKLKKLIASLKTNSISISEAYLFGSYADNRQEEYSDIDVALISSEFSGVRYFDMKKIGRIVRSVDYRIEVHPFSLREKGESMFLDEIIRTGIRVA